ncbi:MAG: COX15/CtaA family protein [Propionibacteriaceae bacterium]|nr:COX15/CtaA family protein [Propionibacteriaceae bacterium]
MKRWFTAAAVLTLASVVLGAVVCATESGAACPNWPGCYPDGFAPAAQLNPLIEFVHRVVAAVTGPTVLVAAVLGRRLADPRPRRLAWIGLAGTISAGLFGMLIVKIGIPWWLGVLDLASALMATVVLLVARLLLAPGAEWAPGPVARPAWTAVGTLAAMHLLALAVAGANSFTRCLSWPLGVIAADRWPWLQVVRVGLAVVAAGAIAVAARRAGRQPGTRLAGRLATVLLVAELGLAALLLAGSGGLLLRTAYAVVAACLFGAVALLAGRASVPAGPGAEPGKTPAPAVLTAE